MTDIEIIKTAFWSLSHEEFREWFIREHGDSINYGE